MNSFGYRIKISYDKVARCWLLRNSFSPFEAHALTLHFPHVLRLETAPEVRNKSVWDKIVFERFLFLCLPAHWRCWQRKAKFAAFVKIILLFLPGAYFHSKNLDVKWSSSTSTNKTYQPPGFSSIDGCVSVSPQILPIARMLISS